MMVKSRVYNNTLYILLSGELDEHTSLYTRTTLDKMLSASKYTKVIFDLSQLSFMDSTGIGVLIGRYKKMKNNSVPIYITNPSSHIEKIFQISGLYEIMPKIN